MLSIRSKKTAREFSRMDSQDMFVVENVDDTSPVVFRTKKINDSKFLREEEMCRNLKDAGAVKCVQVSCWGNIGKENFSQ